MFPAADLSCYPSFADLREQPEAAGTVTFPGRPILRYPEAQRSGRMLHDSRSPARCRLTISKRRFAMARSSSLA